MDARWSPDGKQVIFWSERDGNAELYAMNSSGSNLICLAGNPAQDGDGLVEAEGWQPQPD